MPSFSREPDIPKATGLPEKFKNLLEVVQHQQQLDSTMEQLEVELVAFARVMAPVTGRWLSRDPLKDAERMLGANLYEYVSDDPANGVDPDGLQVVLPPIAPPLIAWDGFWLAGFAGAMIENAVCEKKVTCKLVAEGNNGHFTILYYQCDDGTWYTVTTGLTAPKKGTPDPNPPPKGEA